MCEMVLFRGRAQDVEMGAKIERLKGVGMHGVLGEGAASPSSPGQFWNGVFGSRIAGSMILAGPDQVTGQCD